MRGSLNPVPPIASSSVITLPLRGLGQRHAAGAKRSAKAAQEWLKAIVPSTIIAAVVPLLLFAVWNLTTALGWVAPQLLPSPAVVVRALLELASSGELVTNLACSLRRVVFGFALGALSGLLLGCAMGMSQRLERLLYPSITAIAQVPALGFIPLAMMALGIGESLKLFIVAKAVFVPALIHSLRGVASVPSGYIELAAVNEHRSASRLLRLIVPVSLGQLTTGLRLGLSQAWLALVTVELLASSEGIGYVMIRGRQLNQIDIVLVTAAVIGFVGFALDAVVRRLECLLPDGNRLSKQSSRGGGTSAGFSPQGAIVPIVLLIIWSWAAREAWLNPRFVPSPWQCVATFRRLCVECELLTDVGWSLRRMAWGLFWGVLLGVAFGTLLGRSKWLASALMPSFNAFRQVTLIAWIPLMTLWIGQGEEAKQTFIALAVFVPMALSAFEGARSVSKAHLELSAVFDAKPSARLWLLTLPSAVPQLWGGFELALVYAWLATIAAEYFFRVAPGVGNAMVDGREHFQMDLVLCAMAVVGVLGFVLNRTACSLRMRFLRWI